MVENITNGTVSKEIQENKIEVNNLIEKDTFSQYECKQTELEEITEMLWYVYEDYYAVQENDLYTKANNYDRLRPFLYNIHTLLYDRNKEMQSFIDKVYAERKAGAK